jgi:hypothetical protein
MGELLARGSGKTTRLIKALPHGGFLLVHSTPFANIVRVYLREINRRDIKVASCTNYNELRGKVIDAIGVDHFIEDSDALKDVDIGVLCMLHRIKNVYTLDEIGIPVRMDGQDYVKFERR